MTTLPPSYCGNPHGLISFDKNCTACSVGEYREKQNAKLEEGKPRSYATGGAGPEDLTQVKLILVSDLSGHYEALAGYPFVDISNEKGERNKKGLLNPHNAGGFIRMALELMYGLDTYNEVWCTNALKCDPGAKKPLFNTQTKPCVMRWLQNEFTYLDEYCPTAPILIAGGTAFEAIKLIYPVEAKLLNERKLNGCRRRSDITLGRHPAVFTLNPARAARCEARIETEVQYRRGLLQITKNDWLYPALPGSPLYSYIEDLKFLRPYLTS